MSLSNELEIISRGSIDIPPTQEPSSQSESLTTDMMKTDQKTISLEPLPPEMPRYPNNELVEQKEEKKNEEEEGKEGEDDELSLEIEAEAIPLCLERATHQLAQSRQQTDSLLQRIESLSGRIRSGLSLVDGTGTTVSTLPLTITPSDIGGHTHDVIMTSSLSKDTQYGENPVDCDGDETLNESSTGDLDEIEGGGERGVVSPEGGDVDPKLAKALEKMRKLDKRLADLLMREREVKEQRRQLELQMTGVVDPQETQEQSEDGGTQSVAPVFQTQPAESEPVTDFIQRNIEETGAAVVLSDSEKLRLEQLLAQDDDHTVKQHMDDGSTASVNTETNVFKLSDESQTALRHIDIKLQAMGGCGGVEGDIRDTGCGQLSAAEDSQTLREVDEKLAELKKSSPQHKVYTTTAFGTAASSPVT